MSRHTPPIPPLPSCSGFESTEEKPFAGHCQQDELNCLHIQAAVSWKPAMPTLRNPLAAVFPQLAAIPNLATAGMPQTPLLTLRHRKDVISINQWINGSITNQKSQWRGIRENAQRHLQVQRALAPRTPRQPPQPQRQHRVCRRAAHTTWQRNLVSFAGE